MVIRRDPSKDPDMTTISPKVRRLVAVLRRDELFHTTDSGDGSNLAAGMGCALPFARVAGVCAPELMIGKADRIRALLEHHGVTFDPAEGRNIEATYSPVDGVATIIVIGVTDEMLK